MASPTHALNRTSPKGEKFLGTCMKCGRTNLPISAVNEPCENIAGMSEEDALLLAIEGPSREALSQLEKPGE